ncbi:MAG: methyltransferase domain-containing protein, partial [Candidatus Omnitrophica bacterium]|nr:methyltransferase domain-containing protein [Candidatus Omnitrophota bacterium]
LRENFPQVKLINNIKREGFAENHNKVLKNTQAKYKLILNEDTLILNGAINKLIDFMDTDKNIGASGPKLLFADGSLQQSAFDFLSVTSEIRKAVKKNSLTSPNAAQTPVKTGWLNGSCLLFRSKALAKTGYLDEAFFIFYEDADMCERLQKAGFSVYYNPRAQVTHYYGATQKGKTALNLTGVYYASRSHYFLKHKGIAQFFILNLIFLLFDSLKLLKWSAKNATAINKEKVEAAFIGMRTSFQQIISAGVEYTRNYSKKCICGACSYIPVKRGTYSRQGVKNYFFEIIKCRECGLIRTYPIPAKIECLQDTIDENIIRDLWSKALTREISALCKSGSSILDIGCFTGNLAEELRTAGFHVTGCDINPAAVKKGIGLGRSIKLGDVSECKFENSSFDAIVCNHSLEHIIELDSTICEIKRILKRGGTFFVFVPYHNGLIAKIMGNRWIGWFPQQHAWHFDKKTLLYIILKCGGFKLKSIKSTGMVEPPSLGLRGFIKKIIGKTAGFFNFGDEIEAIFVKE